MPWPSSATEVLNQEFLNIRARLIDLAAALDRVDRGGGSAKEDPRYQQIRQGLAILAEDTAGRIERIQMVFSLPYDEYWQKKYEAAT
jgi:hypothetical protein